MLHVDIMDGHFARNIALSPYFVKSLRPITDLPIDAHLMVECPGDYIDSLASYGADYITVHSETIERDSFRIIRKIKDKGKKLGVALCPATPLENINAYIDEIDMLTIMTVEIGYAGQTFIPQIIKKIEAAVELRARNNFSFFIQADGAIGPNSYKSLWLAGTDAYVMGTSGLFKGQEGIRERCIRMRDEFAQCTGAMI